MAYLVFPPESDGLDGALPYAIAYPDAADQIVIKDLEEWGWKVVKHRVNDPYFLSGLREDHLEQMGGYSNSLDRRPTLWMEWQRERMGQMSKAGVEQADASPRRGAKVKDLWGLRKLLGRKGRPGGQIQIFGCKKVKLPGLDR